VSYNTASLNQGYYSAVAPDNIARPDQIPENIFSQAEVDQLIEWWAYTAYPSASPGFAASTPLLVPVTPDYLIAGSKGNAHDPGYPQRLPVLHNPATPNVGYWRPVLGRPYKPLWALRFNKTNNGVPIRTSPHYRGDAYDPRYLALCEMMSAVYDRWQARSRLPSDSPEHISIPFPLDGGAPNRGLFNVNRLLIRYSWGIPFPAEQYDVSHWAAPAHQDRFPEGPYAIIGLAALEYMLLNTSRIPCNMFMLWRRNASGLQRLNDDQLMDSTKQVACWHSQMGYPCYGPAFGAGLSVQVSESVPTGYTPGRGAGKKGKGGQRKAPEPPTGGAGPSTGGSKKPKGGGTGQSSIKGWLKACVSPAVTEPALEIEAPQPSEGVFDDGLSWEEREEAEVANDAAKAMLAAVEAFRQLAAAPAGA
jgi:hypothetical protein